MSNIKELLASSYVSDVDTGFVGKIESVSTSGADDSIALRGNGVVRVAFVTDNGDIIKKSLHVSKVKVIEQDEFEERLETIMMILNAKAHKLHNFRYDEYDCEE